MTGGEIRHWALGFLMPVLAVVAYHSGVFGIVFLIPLVWVKRRQGRVPGNVATILAAAGIVAMEVVLKRMAGARWTVLDTLLLLLPVLLIVGWVVIDEMSRLGWRYIYRLLTVTAAVGFVLFPVLAFLFKQSAFNQVLGQSFDEAWKQLLQTPGLDVQGLMGNLDKTEFFELLRQAFLGSFLLVFFLFWAFTERVARSFGTEKFPVTLRDFQLPPQGAWVLLGLWALILIQGLLAKGGWAVDLGGFQYVILNCAWIVLVVHSMAGWGILESLMEQWGWPGIAQSVVRLFLVFLVLVPGTGQLVVLVGLPVLAVLELWINFRKRTQGVGL